MDDAKREQNEVSPKGVLGVGWDVGGWMGRKQAAAAFIVEGVQRRWVGVPRTFTIRDLDTGSGEALIRLAWDDAPADVLTRFRVIIAIDAPLGFPIRFRELVGGARPPMSYPGSEIQNPFAYRRTEQHIHDAFEKKALSAPFDKLGNNATVALHHRHDESAALVSNHGRQNRRLPREDQ